MIRRKAIFLRDTIQGFLVLDRDMLDIVQRDINASFDLVRSRANPPWRGQGPLLKCDLADHHRAGNPSG